MSVTEEADSGEEATEDATEDLPRRIPSSIFLHENLEPE
jgi:hypothetical protein